MLDGQPNVTMSQFIMTSKIIDVQILIFQFKVIVVLKFEPYFIANSILFKDNYKIMFKVMGQKSNKR